MYLGQNPIRFGSVVPKKFLKVCHKSLPSRFCRYICINHSKGVWNSALIVLVESPFCQNVDGRDLPHRIRRDVVNKDRLFYDAFPKLIIKPEIG